MIRPVRQAMLLALKDLRLFVADRGALLFALAFPIVLIFAFSTIFEDAGVRDTPIEVVLATEEGPDSLSGQMIAGLTADPTTHMAERDPDAAQQAVDDGDLAGFILFPAGFSEAVQTGQPATLRVVAHPQGDMHILGRVDGVARSLAAEIGDRQLTVRTALALAGSSGDAAAPGRVLAATADTGSRQPGAAVAVQTVSAGDVETVGAANIELAGYLTMFIFFLSGFAAQEFIRERDNHTFDRLIASGVGAGTILAGKWLGTATRSAVQAAILWSVGVFILGVEMGRAPLGTVLVTLGMIAASASAALLLATFARTENAARALVIVVALLLAPLGGSWWPLFVMPPWMQTLAKVTPHAWANDALNRLLLFGATTRDILPNLLALLAFAVVLGVAGVLRARVRA